MFDAALDEPHVVYSGLFLVRVENVNEAHGWDINMPKESMSSNDIV